MKISLAETAIRIVTTTILFAVATLRKRIVEAAKSFLPCKTAYGIVSYDSSLPPLG